MLATWTFFAKSASGNFIKILCDSVLKNMSCPPFQPRPTPVLTQANTASLSSLQLPDHPTHNETPQPNHRQRGEPASHIAPSHSVCPRVLKRGPLLYSAYASERDHQLPPLINLVLGVCEALIRQISIERGSTGCDVEWAELSLLLERTGGCDDQGRSLIEKEFVTGI